MFLTCYYHDVAMFLPCYSPHGISQQVSVYEVIHEKPAFGLCARTGCHAAMRLLGCAQLRALRGHVRPGGFDWVCYRISITVPQEHREHHW